VSTTVEPESSTELTPQERLDAAEKAFAAMNRMLPPGLPPFQLPPFVETAAGVNALANLLLAKGIIGEQEFIDTKTLNWAILIENVNEQLAELKRQASGLVIAGPGQKV
jgi:hypothetical protein